MEIFRSKKRYILIFLICFLRFHNIYAISIETQLNKLSCGEKSLLEYFFRTAIEKEQLGHVLFFANKPASLVAAPIQKKRSLNNQLFIKGWLIWKKYEHLFPHSNYIFHPEIVTFSDETRILHIYVINKKTLLDCLEQNDQFLKQTVGNQYFKEQFIKNIGMRNYKLFDEDQALIGMMLGFGKESSALFKKYKSSGDYEKLISLDRINCTRRDKLNVHPIAFGGIKNSKEVQLLEEIYANELDEIEELVQAKSFLKIILEALING